MILHRTVLFSVPPFSLSFLFLPCELHLFFENTMLDSKELMLYWGDQASVSHIFAPEVTS